MSTFTTTKHLVPHNLDDTIAEMRKKNISYAEWQKARYKANYDVKGHIEKYKKTRDTYKRLGYNIKYK